MDRLNDRLNDETYMRLALRMAAETAGQTGVNPAVGCVVVKDGRIIGLGAHLKRGEPHAEVHALNMAGERAQGATVYVTLEPCAHHGKTPPCCERLMEAQVARVVVASVDPNPLVSGKGIARLREAGIEVVSGLLEEDERRINAAYRKYITTRMPYVTLKIALTLDGRIATRTGDSRWVTGPEAREAVHVLRHRHQAIMVGASTVLADDPELTARLPVPAVQPVRVVADSRLRVPETARIFDGKTPVVVLTTEQADPAKADRLRGLGAEVFVCGPGPRVDLHLAMRQLGEREIASVLLEGGGQLAGAMLKAGLVDRVKLFYAPKLAGEDGIPAFAFAGPERMADALRLEQIEIEHVGGDWCVTGVPVRKGGA